MSDADDKTKAPPPRDEDPRAAQPTVRNALPLAAGPVETTPIFQPTPIDRAAIEDTLRPTLPSDPSLEDLVEDTFRPTGVTTSPARPPRDAPPDLLEDTVRRSSSAAPLPPESWTKESGPENAAPDAPAPTLERGMTIDRYVILARVGVGGMGEVYAAYDPQLDRKVALKLLRSDRVAGMSTDDGRHQLLKEARAMARLKHANVVAVHDAGETRGKLFLAMDFVDGGSLRGWMQKEAKPQPWREVLRRFIAAGEGLSAAHAAGLIHRDFKPDNVLLGRDGSVQVTDFGLAEPVGGKLGVALVAGTPGYMAPEQYSGQPADARTDVFAFCASLWEALFLSTPFPGTELAALQEMAETGRIAPPPAGIKVPAHLLAILKRGLSPAPEKRFASMGALLSELHRDRVSERARLLRVASFSFVLLMSILFGWSFSQRHFGLCRGAEQRWEGIWDAPRKATAKQAILATGVSFAPMAWSTVERTLDAYAADWTRMSTESCEATRVKGLQSDAMLGLRMLCLERGLEQVHGLADLFDKADRGVVEHAVEAVRSIPPLSSCADLVALSSRVAAPPPELLTLVEEARGRLARNEMRLKAGRFEEALTAAKEEVVASGALPYAPVRAEALQLEGESAFRLGRFDAAREHLDAAILAAEGFPMHVEVLVEAWTTLVLVETRRARWAEAHLAAEHAAAYLSSLPDPDRLEGDLENARGILSWTQGVYAEAREHFERSLALRRRSLGEDAPEVARAMSNLVASIADGGREEGTGELMEKAIAITEKSLGPDHPQLAEELSNLGRAKRHAGELPAAIASYERALRIKTVTYGKDAVALIPTLALCAEALALAGRFPDATRNAELSLKIAREKSGADHPDLVIALNSLALVQHLAGDHAAAFASYGEAARIAQQRFNGTHPRLTRALTGKGREQLDLGDATLAEATLEKAVALYAAGPRVTLNETASAQFLLARARWEIGKERATALQTAARLAEALQGSKDVEDQHLFVSVDTFLKGKSATAQ